MKGRGGRDEWHGATGLRSKIPIVPLDSQHQKAQHLPTSPEGRLPTVGALWVEWGVRRTSALCDPSVYSWPKVPPSEPSHLGNISPSF